MVVARLPSGESSSSGQGTMSEGSQKSVRLVLSLDQARDARLNPVLERAKPHVSGVRGETQVELAARRERDGLKAAASVAEHANKVNTGNAAAAAILG